MDHAEMNNNTTDENISNTIRKKSSFLRDGSYRIFHITKNSKDDSDDDDNRSNNKNIDQTMEKKKDPRNNKYPRKSLNISNRNGLKKFLFLHKTTCELSSIEVKTPCQANELFPPPVIYQETTSVELLKTNKQHVQRDSTANWYKANAIDETMLHNHLLVRADKFEPPNRKQVLINIHPEGQRSFHRRRKRFIVACGTVLMALSVIITIIIYVIIMTIKHKTQMNQLNFYRHPR